MSTVKCPTDNELRSCLAGSWSDSRLTDHINACESCQQRLDQLAQQDQSAEAVGRNLRPSQFDQPTHIERVLQGIRENGDDANLDEPILPHGFLVPSDYPGSMGRFGQYELLQLVGRGGMGAVFRAFDPSLQRIVAIKLLAPHLAHHPLARRRFIREAQAAAAVSHDHVVTIHAIDESVEQPAIVMQYITGRSLQQKLDAEGSLELKEILRIGLQTASGLAAAHAQGLVHRDVKPANILLENGVQRVKLTDFGLARAVDDSGLTASGVIAGTPQYMAPEQAQGESITSVADLFSLGSVLYAMCTGLSPFRASTTMGVLKNVCESSPRPIRELNPDIPDGVCRLIDRLLAKNPADRFQSAKEVAEELERWLAHIQQPLAVPQPNTKPAPQPQSSRLSDPAPAFPATTQFHTPTSEDSDDDDDESPVKLGRTADERQLLQRAVGYVELPGFGLTGVGAFSMIALWSQVEWSTFRLFGDASSTKGLSFTSSPRELFQAGGPLLQSAAFLVMIYAGNNLRRLQNRTLGVVGAVLANMTAVLAVPGPLGAIVGGWTLLTLLRDDVIKAFHLTAELRELKEHQRATLVHDDTNPTLPIEQPSIPQAMAASSMEKSSIENESATTPRPDPSDSRTQWPMLQRHRRLIITLTLVIVALIVVRFAGYRVTWPKALQFPFTAPNVTTGSSAEPPRIERSQPDAQIPIGRNDARCLAVSAGGAFMAVAGGSEQDGFLKIWNAQTLKELSLHSATSEIRCLAFGDHGRTLATGDAQGRVALYELPSGTRKWEFTAHHGPVSALSFSDPYFGLISGSEDGTVRLWKDRLKEQVDLPEGSGGVTDIAVSRDGTRIAVAGRNGQVQILNTEGKEITQLSFPSPPLHITFDEADGQLGVAMEDGKCKVWSLKDKRVIGDWTLPGLPKSLSTAYWKSTETAVFVAATEDGRVSLYDFDGFRPCVTLNSSSPALGADLFGPNDQVLSAHADGQLRIWHL
jgi:serine/threonine protein kinase